MLNGKNRSDSFPNIDVAVQREFQALREYLVEIEQTPTNGNGKSNGATLIMPATNGQMRAWWVILQGIDRLPKVSAARERLSRVPGCVAAQVVSLSPSEVRLSITTTSNVDECQLEFALGACSDVPNAKVIARNSRPVR